MEKTTEFYPTIEEDPRYQKLLQEHRELDEQIKKLNEKRYLHPSEEMEKKKWQKLKLKLKDEIVKLERFYRLKNSESEKKR